MLHIHFLISMQSYSKGS